MTKLVKWVADQVPDHSDWVLIGQCLGMAALAIPTLLWVWPRGRDWLPEHAIAILQGAGTVALAIIGMMVLCKLAVRHKWWIAHSSTPARKRQISLGGMVFDEKALFTNILAFGSIGSGKTAAVIYPVLDSLTGLYKSEDPTDPNAKWGGFVLDVKGDFHEAVVFLMQKHGRDVLNDLVVIRPDNDYYILELEELTTKEHFLVSCMGGTTLQECDKVLARALGDENIVGTDKAGSKFLRMPNGDYETLSSHMFSDRGTFRRPEVHKLLTQLEFDVQGLSVRWLGWREDKSGRLHRVTHTVNRQVQYAHDERGQTITTSKPARLRYLGVHSINNGLTYNLISKTAASTEAAGRIMAVAEVTGNSMGGDNAYWSNASEKHIAACVELFRQVEGPMGRECSVNEVQKFTSNEQFLTEYVKKLDEVIKQKQQLGASDFEILLLRNLTDYFAGEWMKLDPKTKGNIASCVTNLFGDITRNEQLIKTFCQPSRFSFEDCLNDGKVYTLVLSAYPNAQMLIGTCMKLDFQQVVLKRTQAASVNKDRFLLFVADEYQYFITTSGGGKTGGDEKFLSVARQSRICNLVCTQAKSSLLAVQKDENKIDAFVQCFGSRVFLQNLDEKTNKLAEQTLGQFWAERTDHSGPDLKLSSMFGEGKSGSITRRQEKQNRFEASHFTQMLPFEAVLFNKEQAAGRRMVKANLKPEARFWDKKDLSNAANDYYQGYIENRAFELGLSHLFDPKNNIREDAPTDAEKRNRANMTLRSWRNGVPIGRVIPADKEAVGGLAGRGGLSSTTDLDKDAQEQTSNDQDSIAEALGSYPSMEVLNTYFQQEPMISDYEISKASDPFYGRTDCTLETQKPKSANGDEPEMSTSFEEDFIRNNQSLNQKMQSKRSHRPLSNITGVPEIETDTPCPDAPTEKPLGDSSRA